MENSFKNKNTLVIVFELVVIALSIVGITFAAKEILSNRTKTLIVGEEYNVEYLGDTDVIYSDLEPISDNLINYDTKDGVIRIEFSVKGAKTNKDDDLIYDVMLNEMNIDCALLNKYTKWNLYKNGKLLSNGSLDPAWDGDVLSDSMRLTNIQQDLPNYNKEYDKYVLIFWISESCDDIGTCELVDQSAIVGSNMSMKVFIALYSGRKTEYERVPNYDNTCANKPELYDYMIPVKYTNGEWVVADKTNSDKNNLWYDYSNSMWANAVIVKKGDYSRVGTKINNDDVMGYFVWIPRFRYKLWNANGANTDSYDAYDNGINIIFENGFNKIENNSNDNYLTHPAFGDNLKGFWISKYEFSKRNNEYAFIPGVETNLSDSMESYLGYANELSNSYAKNDTKIHVINNLEWGAALYLSHSKYGVCKNDGCNSIDANGNYISGSNKQDTLTRNMYGVFDMAGAGSEYVVNLSGLGTATKEVTMSNGLAWYDSYSMTSMQDYLLRGGVGKGLFWYGKYDMDIPETSSRVVLGAK